MLEPQRWMERFDRREVLRSCPSGGCRSPRRRGPPGSARPGAQMSAPRYWLSASVFTMTSAPRRSHASSPRHERRREPRFLGKRTMWWTPKATGGPLVWVPSVLPSSMISTSISSTPSRVRGRSARVWGRVSRSFRQGTWMMSFTPWPRLARGRRYHGFKRTTRAQRCRRRTPRTEGGGAARRCDLVRASRGTATGSSCRSPRATRCCRAATSSICRIDRRSWRRTRCEGGACASR